MSRVRVVKRTTLYQGKVIRLIREVLRANGRTIVRETVRHPGAVVVLPVLPDGRLVFVRQYRRAVGRRLLELPAGTLTPGERKHVCARRELIEETGWKPSRLTRLGRFYAAPGFISEQLTLFLADGLTQVGACPEPDEDVRPVVLTLAEALAKVASGGICDAKTIIGLLCYDRRKRRLSGLCSTAR